MNTKEQENKILTELSKLILEEYVSSKLKHLNVLQGTAIMYSNENQTT